MSYINQCENCGKQLEGYINKRFCGDACRKYYKRHKGIPVSKIRQEPRVPEIPDKSGQEEKSRTVSPGSINTLENYAIKKFINVGGNLLQKKLSNLMDNAEEIKPVFNPAPLKMETAEAANTLFGMEDFINKVRLSPEFRDFLGDLSFPFKILVWGKPGDGKSTFCMKLANEIVKHGQILYVSGEEDLKSATLKDKQRRSILPDNRKACVFINRLPATQAEWKNVLIDPSERAIRYRTIFYDSITKLDITPYYIDAVANECKMNFFNTKISHVFISHSHKDGSHYRGDGSWGHEVDIIIRCDQGTAIIEKNRFGVVGKELKIY